MSAGDSASRILAITSALGARPNAVMATAWRDALLLPSLQTEPPNEAAIASALAALHGEIDIVQTELHRREVPEAMFKGFLDRIREVAGLQRLSQPLDGLRGLIGPEVLITLAWIDYILRDARDNKNHSLDEIEALLEEAEALASALSSSDLSGALRRFLRDALADYTKELQLARVRGTEGLAKVAEDTAGRMVVFADELREDSAAPPAQKDIALLTRFGRFISRAAKFSDKMEKIAKLVQRALQGVDWVMSRLPPPQ